MHEADLQEVEKVVLAAVRRERQLWALTLVVACFTILILSQNPVCPYNNVLRDSKYSTATASQISGVLRRRLLQNNVVTVPATEHDNLTEQIVQDLQNLFALAEGKSRTASAPAGEIAGNFSPAEVPIAEPIPSLIPAAVAPQPVVASACNCCNCTSAVQSTAPSFLSDLMSYDATSGTLTISATTVELAGSLVVTGYTGVKQSLFVGGDPAVGSASTEVAGGRLLLYASDASGPKIGAFTAGATGFTLSQLTVQGELFEDPLGNGQAHRVSTRLF